MQEDDEDIERWVQQLRGKTSAKETSAQARALRTAIAASTSAESDAAVRDREAHARLIEQLEAKGLLGNAPTKTWWRRLIRAVDGRRERFAEPRLSSDDTAIPAGAWRRPWHAWVGAVAAVLIVAIGLRLALPPEPVERGFAGSVNILSEQPEATLAEVSLELERLGLQPRRVMEDGRVFLELEISSAQLETFFKWAEPRGERPVAAGRYRVFVDDKSSASR